MSDQQPYFVILFDGGYSSDKGPNVDKLPMDGYHIHLPFLARAENIVFSLDGGIRKAPGTSKLNTVAAVASTVIKGLYDAWFSGTSGTPTQKRIITVGTKIMKEDADGTFDDLFTGLTAGGVPSFAMLEDLLVICSTAHVPKSWDLTTAQNLAGSPPNAPIVVEHKNRLWMAGAAAAPSRLYYSALLSPADWGGAGSGSIDISPDDGDGITSLASHQNELMVFKGPYKGSIHRITGNSPDDFSRVTHLKGIGAVNHNCTFPFMNDLCFMWRNGTVHSLNAVSQYGDFAQVALSRDIATFLRTRLTIAQQANWSAANASDEGVALFTVAIDASSTNNCVLMMDYRFGQPRWSIWTDFAAGCVATVMDSGKETVMAGGNDGFVRKYFQTARSIDDTTPISMAVATPYMSFISPKMMKTLVDLSLQLTPRSNNSINVSWTRDSKDSQMTTIDPGGSSAVLGSFILGTDTLGAGAEFLTRFADFVEGGEFRDIRLEIEDANTSTDVEIHGIGITIEGGAESTENQ